MIKRYSLKFPIVILYMLQASEYVVSDYIKWVRRTKDFRTVMKRQELTWTSKVKLLALVELAIAAALGFALYFALGLFIAIIAFALLLPWVLMYGIVVPLLLGEVLIQKPKTKRMAAAARQKIAKHPALKIAIAGSFGKTTAKEVLKAVLSEGKKVAATPGNMNTVIGNSRFIMKLDGDEDIIIFELGEAKVGDVKELCELVQPQMGLITGINEAHLSTFGTIENTINTIFELQDYLGDKPIYKNKESILLRTKLEANDPRAYDKSGVGGWKVSNIHTTIQGTHFALTKGKNKIKVESQLLGEHHVGLLAAVVSIADELGLSAAQIEAGLAKTKPFEHRMQPYKLAGAWVIDDTYNGNSEGVEAGLKLLKSLDAKRRIYVTPGLVEQGDRTHEIHKKIGVQIAKAADVAVLMQNSTTQDIMRGLEKASFKGKVQVVADPLMFYTHLEYFVAAGDVVLMQNDWTDNYE